MQFICEPSLGIWSVQFSNCWGRTRYKKTTATIKCEHEVFAHMQSKAIQGVQIVTLARNLNVLQSFGGSVGRSRRHPFLGARRLFLREQGLVVLQYFILGSPAWYIFVKNGDRCPTEPSSRHASVCNSRYRRLRKIVVNYTLNPVSTPNGGGACGNSFSGRGG